MSVPVRHRGRKGRDLPINNRGTPRRRCPNGFGIEEQPALRTIPIRGAGLFLKNRFEFVLIGMTGNDISETKSLVLPLSYAPFDPRSADLGRQGEQRADEGDQSVDHADQTVDGPLVVRGAADGAAALLGRRFGVSWLGGIFGRLGCRFQLGIAGLGGRQGLIVLHKGFLIVGESVVSISCGVDLRLALVGVRHLADGVDQRGSFVGSRLIRGGFVCRSLGGQIVGDIRDFVSGRFVLVKGLRLVVGQGVDGGSGVGNDLLRGFAVAFLGHGFHFAAYKSVALCAASLSAISAAASTAALFSSRVFAVS